MKTTIMASAVEVVARQAQLTFARGFAQENFSDCLSKLARCMGQLRAKDLGICNKDTVVESCRNSRAPVTYIEVTENEYFSMGVFVLKSGARIPLHDHPGMHGVLKVIKGAVQITSYSTLDPIHSRDSKHGFPIPRDLIRRLSPSEQNHLVPVEKHDPVEAHEDDENSCILTPNRGNFHEIKAMRGSAAFVDILAPPYNKEERDCHYYLAFETTCPESDIKAWLLKTLPPNDYWCDSAHYHGPQVDID